MGDLKTPFDKAVYPNTSSLGGDSVTESGSDPNADGGDGPAGLQAPWGSDRRILPETENPSKAESPNSLSGLPPLPTRFEPAAETVEPPDLTDRNPGTIDKR